MAIQYTTGHALTHLFVYAYMYKPTFLLLSWQAIVLNVRSLRMAWHVKFLLCIYLHLYTLLYFNTRLSKVFAFLSKFRFTAHYELDSSYVYHDKNWFARQMDILTYRYIYEVGTYLLSVRYVYCLFM